MKLFSSQIALMTAALVAGTSFTSCMDPYSTNTSITYRTGSEVRTLPPGYRTEIVGGTRYYTHNGTYYRPKSGRYVIVETPHRRERNREVYVEKLPPGYHMVRYGGRYYYRVNNIYYQQRGPGYVVVERPF